MLLPKIFNFQQYNSMSLCALHNCKRFPGEFRLSSFENMLICICSWSWEVISRAVRGKQLAGVVQVPNIPTNTSKAHLFIQSHVPVSTQFVHKRNYKNERLGFKGELLAAATPWLTAGVVTSWSLVATVRLPGHHSCSWRHSTEVMGEWINCSSRNSNCC